MRVVAVGDFKSPLLLDSNQVTGLLIETEDGQPAVIIRVLPNNKGYIRLFKGEDKEFDQVANQLGIKQNKK